MKKLFYSLIMLIAMSVTFVACEQPTPEPEQNQQENNQGNKPGENEEENKNENENENDVKSNAKVYSAQYVIDDQIGTTMYLFEVLSENLSVNNGKLAGDGEYTIITMYATTPIQEDGFPAAKQYNVIPQNQLPEKPTDCVSGGAVSQDGKPSGTYQYIVQNGQSAGGLLCTGGFIKFEGNTTKGIMTANLEFTGANGETINKEYVYSGKFVMQQRSLNAPTRAKINIQ